jgi:hypothetical protein
MLLIHGDEEMYGPPSGTPEADALLEEYFALGRRLREAGIDEPSEELDRASTATVVRLRDGQTVLSDGPFTEAREQLGGFYIVRAESIDEAIAWAIQIPGARTGAIEIRPIIEHNSAE